MGFFARMKNSLARFMYGRNGADQLSFALLWLSIIIDIVSRFIKVDALRAGIALLSTVIAAVALWRMFSKNLYKRRAENTKFLEKLWWPVKRKFQGAKQQRADKEHKYFTCAKCSAVCRVPRGKGKIVITCPRCGNEIHGKS